MISIIWNAHQDDLLR